MKIAIEKLHKTVYDFLIDQGLNAKDSQTFTELVIEQELIGNLFSAVGELTGKHKRLIEGAKNATEELVVTKNAARLYKGNGRPAVLITADHLPEAISFAKKQGIFAYGIYDSTYNEFFDMFSRRIAAEDCIGIIVENGGPQGVVPFGGRKDVTGTNPLAYGIPTNDDPIIFDAATAAHAYGLIRLSKESGQRLPDNAYVNKNGDITTDPNEAYAVLPFGGFKGYAINLLVDVLSGCLVRAKSGLELPADSPERHIGTFIIIIDPASFGDIAEFKNSTSKLVKDILAVPPVNPDEPVRVPGIRGAERKTAFEKTGEIVIDDESWEKFQEALDKKQ